MNSAIRRAPDFVNVTDNGSIQAVVDAVASDFGRIDINVNCAGIGTASRTLRKKEGALAITKFNFFIQVNLIGTFSALSKCAVTMQISDHANQ